MVPEWQAYTKGLYDCWQDKEHYRYLCAFWLYDLNSKVQVNALCTKVRTYTRGDYVYTETRYYDVYRDINLDYLKVPVDASEKMNDELMDKLEPYNYQEIKDFKPPLI